MNAKKDLSIFQSSNEFDVFEGEGIGLQDPGSSASASGESWNLQPAFSVDTALARATGETKTLKDNLSKVKDLSGIFLAWNGVDPASNILDVVPRLKDKPMSQVLAQNMKRWHDILSGSASTAIHKSYGAKSSYLSDEVDDKIPNPCVIWLTAPSDEECTNWIAHHNPQRPKESRPTLKYVYPSNESTIEEAQDFILGSVQKLLQGPERVITWPQRAEEQPPAYVASTVPAISTAGSNTLALPDRSGRPSSAAGSYHSDVGADEEARPQKKRSFVDLLYCFRSKD
ncbi:hypothetical protein EHS25_007985 [Saitozyma podzolica]|uniref:Uncharacterized protein n=1 Tax=Saitozyma podzolica TaxID=1890683 RepID=A0A427YNA9_9TREE|nr:hypothetical protein EHS25_007985 [Saitozyma podzolica]